jgi:uncharacterized protein
MTRPIIFYLLIISMLAHVGCQPDQPKTSPVTTPTTPLPPSSTAPKEMPEPPFVQEGVLDFYGPDGKKVLHRLSIEIAANSEERQQGLMWRKSMANDQGMLFIFEYPEIQGFWMRNTYIPLDIIYISDRLEIVSIQKNCPPLNDRSLPSGKPAQYVMEINAGLCDKLGIQPGNKVGWANDITNEIIGGFKR